MVNKDKETDLKFIEWKFFIVLFLIYKEDQYTRDSQI